MKIHSIGVLFAIALLPNGVNASMESDEENLSRLCFAIGQMLIGNYASESSRITYSELPLSFESDFQYWYAELFGRRIPVPVSDEQWTHDIHPLGGSVSLGQTLFDISVTPALWEALPTTVVGGLSKSLGLVEPTLTRFEMLLLGAKITPDDVLCDPANTQKTVNELAALMFKSQQLNDDDVVQQLGDREILIHNMFEHGERWEYYFSTGEGLIKKVTLRQWPASRYGAIGFFINAQNTIPYSAGEPNWLIEFFVSAEKVLPKSVAEMKSALDSSRVSGDANP